MSEKETTYAERLLMLVAEELYAIRFLLTYPDREGLTLNNIPAEDIVLKMEKDIEKFRDDLGLS